MQVSVSVGKKLRYIPKRDIPIAVKETKTLSPSKIRDWIREHKIKKDARGKRVQVIRSISSISHWFERNPKIFKQLETELKEEVFEQESLNETIFENGSFKELASIKNWMRDLAGSTVENAWLNLIKRICVGNMRIKRGRLDIEGWGLKHPDRLNLEDAKDFIAQLKRNKVRSREWRLALRSFLQSKGIVVRSTDISGELEQDAGQYAYLYISKEKIYQIFEWLKRINQDAYRASKFAYTTASRITATLEASTEYINKEERTILVFEKSKPRKKKRRFKKQIRQDLWKELDLDHRKGKLFNITAEEINKLLRQAYKEIIPELEPQIPQPFHFWRHMFAQHMLRASGWNTQMVAKLGGWTVATLERYYGKMDEQTAFKDAKKILPFI